MKSQLGIYLRVSYISCLLCIFAISTNSSDIFAQVLPRLQIQIPVNGRFPVTDRAVNNADNTFRFAIMSDRTGGMLPGVFEKAVYKVGLMQPEFVLSVGDLIDGYTEVPEVWDAQWDEFEEIVDKLTMPFFFVPGNHDISNEALLSVWENRLGPPYYHFIYKDVLFLALHTEDGYGSTGGISTQQAAYFEKVLKENADVRWTMIFMHRPLWHYGDKAGYDVIEQHLIGRNYTVFSGHHHHYLHAERNGMKHYVLATSGGGSLLRGVEFGEFEQITWVTMTEEGPQVAHIELDGIHDESIVTEQNYDIIQALRNGNWMNVEPVLLKSNNQNSAHTQVNVINNTDSEMIITGTLEPNSSLRFNPVNINERVDPGDSLQLSIEIQSDNELDSHAINESGQDLELKASYVVEGKTVGLTSSRRLLFDSTHQLHRKTSDILLDGYLNDWDDSCFITVTNPVYIHEDWDWNGPEDGLFRFCAQMDDNLLYIGIIAHDDRIIVQDSSVIRGWYDQFYVNIDAFAPESRRTDIPNRLYGSMLVSNDYHFQIRVAPGIDIQSPEIETNFNDIVVQSAVRINESDMNIVAELVFPLSAIQAKQGLNWSNIRLNIGWMDHDRPENTKPSMLWWRPVWGQSVDHPSFGIWEKVVNNN